MLKRRVLLCALVVLVAGLSACILDPKNDPTPVPPVPPIKDLTHKEDVINNIEVAYNKRNIKYYEGVLDQDFTFFLSPGDINNGLPESWNRPDEIDANSKLLDPAYAALPCQSVYMDIRNEEGISWTEFNPASAPTETWYTTTLYYDFKFEIAPNTYIPLPGAKATFTVRDAGPHGKYAHHWQLVEFRDLGNS